MKKKVIVCDYDNPLKFTFPNKGFGSAENKFWEIAKVISEFKGYEVVVTGPLWRIKYLPNVKHYKKRLNKKSLDDFLKIFGKADYLFAGSEYFDKKEYKYVFSKVADKQISYVDHIYEFKEVCFDKKKKFLFCYSEEMMERYKAQSPIKSLLFNTGVDEKPFLTKKPKDYLVWIGRIDEDKSPHFAIMAAKILKMPIYILGKSLYQPKYRQIHSKLFSSDQVKEMGLVVGTHKMRILSEAKCGIYTCGKNFSEARGCTIGELLCSGVPVAGMTWKSNDAICESVINNKIGHVTKVNRKMNDQAIAAKLANSISKCLCLDRENIYKINKERFNMEKIIIRMIKAVDYFNAYG
jgi:glycosyltransferase involved in cell wall biosynthesis